MDELIVIALQGRATARQLEELREWRRASPSHESRLRELEALWRLSAVHVEIDTLVGAPSVEEVLGESVEPARATGGGRRVWLARAPGIAAALLAGILLGRAIPFDAPAAIAGPEFHTGPGEMATAALADGTIVRLGPDTRLRVVLAADVREVWLDGRAFFAVARDPRRTFRVRTPGGDATVLGTRFEVDTREEGLRLLVVDGRVAVSSGQDEVVLSAGELASAVRGGGTSVVEVPDPESRLDWLGAFIAFESTPLRRVARELEIRLGLVVEIADSAVANRTVTAWFDEEDRDEIVRVICRTAGVQCRTAAGVTHMEEAS